MLRATLRSLLARKVRLVLSAMAVVLGVAFVAGALTLTSTLGRVFDDLFASVGANTDVEVRGPLALEGAADVRAPVPATVLPALRQVDGVQAAVGDVSGYAAVIGKDGKAYSTGGAPSLGVNYDADPATSAFTSREGRPPAGEGEIALDAGTADKTGYRVGDRVPLVLRDGRADPVLTGTFGFGTNDNVAGASIVAMDDATAQRLLGRPGEFDAVRLAGRDGLSQAELLERVRPALPPGLEAVTGQQASDEQASDLQQALGFFNTFLLVFAAVALFVGAFLIFNTFTILVAQRSRELALLRALGASRGQVTRSVVAESVVVGLLASVLGFGAGLGVAALLRWLLGRFGGTLPDGPLVVEGRTLVISLAVGTGVTVLAALLPARRASKVPPVAAMRDASVTEGSLRRATVVGAVLLALGVAGVAVGLQGELLLLGVGALLAFLGVAALSPLISRPVARLVGAPLARRLPGRLGRLNAMRNPRRTAATAAALMIGLALVSAVSVLGASAKASVTALVGSSLASDLVVQGVGGAQMSPAVGTELGGLPEVAQVDRVAFDEARIGNDTTFVTAVSASAVGRSLELEREQGRLDLRPDSLLVASDYAEEHDLRVGEQVPVTLSRGAVRPYELTGTYAPNDFVGPVLLDQAVAAEGFAEQLDGAVLLTARDGTSAAALRTAVDAATADEPTVEVLTTQEFTAGVTAQIDTIITIITVLLALSVLIAVLGIVNTLALAVLERTRELGMLRAVGLARRQTRRMVTVEAVIVAVFGALLGIVVGSAFGVAFQRALADEGITELVFPVGRLVVFVVVAGVAGVVAAVLPARRAARLDVLRAIATT